MSTEDNASVCLSPEAERWLTSHVSGYEGPGRLTKFGFGQSNPTYRLAAASGNYVLRRKPFGTLLPKAHAIEREFRVLGALASTDVPVPRARAFCEDPGLLGAPFYIMDFVPGRIFHDQRLPDLTGTERAAIFDAGHRQHGDAAPLRYDRSTGALVEAALERNQPLGLRDD